MTASASAGRVVGHPRANMLAGAALITAVVVFFLGETIAASAWHNPTYSYWSDWISDLGVPGSPTTSWKGHVLHSPMALMFNITTFVGNGVLVTLAGLLLRPRGKGLDRPAARWQFRLAMAYGAGLIIAAFFHENTFYPEHALGAALSIGGGNVIFILTGRLGTQYGLPTWLARTFTGVGVFGLAVGLVMNVLSSIHPTLPHYSGVLERVAGYPVIFAELVAGVCLLVESAQLRRRSLALAA
jgi:hypothetical membrane protein